MPSPKRNNFGSNENYKKAVNRWRKEKGKQKVTNSPTANSARQIINSLISTGHIQEAVALGTASRNFQNAVRASLRQIVPFHAAFVGRRRQSAIQQLINFRMCGAVRPNFRTLSHNLKLDLDQVIKLVFWIMSNREREGCGALIDPRIRRNEVEKEIIRQINHFRRSASTIRKG
jgi:hypothetical protein